MVLADICSLGSVYTQSNRIAYFDHTLGYNTYMSDLATKKLDRIFYFKSCIRKCDHTSICFLTTHSCIERCFFNNDRTCLSISQCIYKFIFCRKNCYFCLMSQSVISYKFTCNARINRFIYSHVCTHVIRYLTGFTCSFLLFLHGCLETFFIHCESFFLKNFYCKVNRESISIIKFECICSCKYFLTFLIQILFHLIQNRKSLIDCLAELIFFLN